MAEIPLIDFEPVAVYTCQGSASPSSPVSVNVTEKDTSWAGSRVTFHGNQWMTMVRSGAFCVG